MAHPSSHYIRTIHTSFTAAHSGPWARTNAVPLAAPLYQVPSQKFHQAPVLVVSQQPQLSSPPASGAGGRRRAYAFRAPSPAPMRTGGYKFDPFADEPTVPVPSIATLASLSAPPTPRLAAASLPPPHHPPPRRQNRGYYAGQQQPRTGLANQRMRNTGSSYPETAERARFGPPTTEIWRMSSIPTGRSLTYEFEEYDYEGGSGGNAPSARRANSAPPPSPAPPVRQPQPIALRTPSPPAARATVSPPSPNRFFNDKDAKAKLVAGILLNRVHAVGKPRRRVPSPVGAPKVYVPSCLSTVVACET